MKKLLIILLLFPSICFAKHQHPEKYYQEIWCNQNNGKTEVIMENGTRCDCLTSSHSIEFDFAHKWAEAIGQSLCYGMETKKMPGIVIIMESPEDVKYVKRTYNIIKTYNLPIQVWTMW